VAALAGVLVLTVQVVLRSGAGTGTLSDLATLLQPYTVDQGTLSAMAATIESTGSIEIICDTAGLAAMRQAELTFHAWDDAVPPYLLRIQSPSGETIVDRVIRSLPTGEPQAPPPVTFTVMSGEYKIVISQLKGKTQGQAILRVP